MEDMKYIIPEESSDAIISDVTKFREIENELRQLFKTNQYQEVLLPSFEYVDLYQAVNYGTSSEKMFQYINHEGKNVAMRLDFTIPIARLYAKSKIDLNAKYCYFGKVYRKETIHKGRNSEFYQAGVELIHYPGMKGDLQCLKLILKVLSRIQLQHTILELGSASFFKRLCQLVGEHHDDLTNILKYRSISEMKKFVKKNDYSNELNTLLLKLPTLFGDLTMLEEIITQVKDQQLKDALLSLKEVYLKLPVKQGVIFDLGMVPTMSYYTGLMIKVYSDQCAKPIISGGRYDDLLPCFNKNVSAIGFCCHLNYILEALGKEGEIND